MALKHLHQSCGNQTNSPIFSSLSYIRENQLAHKYFKSSKNLLISIIFSPLNFLIKYCHSWHLHFTLMKLNKREGHVPYTIMSLSLAHGACPLLPFSLTSRLSYFYGELSEDSRTHCALYTSVSVFLC